MKITGIGNTTSSLERCLLLSKTLFFMKMIDKETENALFMDAFTLRHYIHVYHIKVLQMYNIDTKINQILHLAIDPSNSIFYVHVGSFYFTYVMQAKACTIHYK